MCCFTNYTVKYKTLNGFNIPTYIEVEWDLASGKFMYGKFNIEDIEKLTYNDFQLIGY